MSIGVAAIGVLAAGVADVAGLALAAADCTQANASSTDAVSLSTGGTGLPDGALTNLQLQQMYAWIQDLARIHGLVAGMPLSVSPLSRSAGPVSQAIVEVGDTVTISRL